MPVQVL